MVVTKDQLLAVLLNSPALATPPRITLNFINLANLDTNYHIELVICMTGSLLVVCMRIWTKARLIRKFGREDYKIWSILFRFLRVGNSNKLQGSTYKYLWRLSHLNLLFRKSNVIYWHFFVDIVCIYCISLKVGVKECTSGTWNLLPSQNRFMYITSWQDLIYGKCKVLINFLKL